MKPSFPLPAFYLFTIQTKPLAFFLFFLFAATALNAQTLVLPGKNQQAAVSQFVGLAKVEIDYFRKPKGKTAVLGGHFPLGEIWHAEPNQQTRIAFSEDVMVQGQALKAGRYSLHVLPFANECVFIFNKEYVTIGAAAYNEEADALRVNAEYLPIDKNREYLTFEFDDPSSKSTNLTLRWGNLAAGLLLEFNEHDIVLEKIHNDFFKGQSDFGWETWYEAAKYCAENNINHQEALMWAENSIRKEANYYNYIVQSKLFEQVGEISSSYIAMKKALKLASEKDVVKYADDLMESKQPAEAIRYFHKTMRASRYDYILLEALGDAYQKQGDIKHAKKFYQKALKKCDSEEYKKDLKIKFENLYPQ